MAAFVPGSDSARSSVTLLRSPRCLNYLLQLLRASHMLSVVLMDSGLQPSTVVRVSKSLRRALRQLNATELR